MQNKLRSASGLDTKEDVFALETILPRLRSNDSTDIENDIELGEWGKGFTVYCYDGFAYAINESFTLYLTYPMLRNLNKDEKKSALEYRLGVEAAKEKRKPSYGDICLYFGLIVASKLNEQGKPVYQVREVSLEHIKGIAEGDKLTAIYSTNGVVAIIPKDLINVVTEALLLKAPRGI